MIQEFADFVVYSLLGLAKDSPAGMAANFFVYDSIKVTLLLATIVFVVGFVRTYVTPQRVRKLLGGRREGVGNVIAAIVGIPICFCSCSGVPLFIGFVEAGVPLGVTFSFLIAAPLINEIAAVMLFALFGWQVAALYIGSGLVIAIIAGIIIGRLHLEGEVEGFVFEHTVGRQREKKKSFRERIDFAVAESKRITFGVLPYLLFGIAVGGLIHGYAPADFLTGIAGRDNPLAVPVAVIAGIPLYSNSAGMVPIVGALTDKGVPMGTALAFMMAVIGLSLPELIILRRVLKPKLLAVLVGILFVAFTFTGYLFNAVLG